MDYCIKEVVFHLKRAIHILEQGLKDPEKYRRESEKSYHIMAKAFPMMLLFSQLDDHSEGTTPSDEESYASQSDA